MSNPPSSRTPSEPPPAKRERNAIETKKRLLDAAEAEFAAKGYAGARLREVANAAGVQQALIHHYFEDKDGLYRAVLDRALEQTTADSWAILGKVTGIVELCEAFVDMLCRFYSNHANFLAMLRMEAASGSPLLDLIQTRTRPVFDAAEALLRRYQLDGKLRQDVPPGEIIISILSMTLFPLQEAPLLEALWPGRPDRPQSNEERRRVIVAIALRGLLPLGCSDEQIGCWVAGLLGRWVGAEEWRLVTSGALPLHPRRGLCPLHPQQGYAPCTAAENPGSAPLGSLHSPDPLCALHETCVSGHTLHGGRVFTWVSDCVRARRCTRVPA
jgi:TetR/AcrR family transcriptional regulator